MSPITPTDITGSSTAKDCQILVYSPARLISPTTMSSAWKWLTLKNLLGHAEIAADFADFVLEEVFERLDELELHALGQASDVVMALDGLRRAAHRARLDDV